MIPFYRVTDGAFSGVDTFDSCPAGWVAPPPPTEDLAPGEAYLWDGAGWIVGTDPAIASATAAAVERLWREAWSWGDRQFAESDRTTILAWLAAGLLTPAGAQRWRDVISWHDAVFLGPYQQAKAAITAAGTWVEADWSSWPPCLCT